MLIEPILLILPISVVCGRELNGTFCFFCGANEDYGQLHQALWDDLAAYDLSEYVPPSAVAPPVEPSVAAPPTEVMQRQPTEDELAVQNLLLALGDNDIYGPYDEVTLRNSLHDQLLDIAEMERREEAQLLLQQQQQNRHFIIGDDIMMLPAAPEAAGAPSSLASGQVVVPEAAGQMGVDPAAGQPQQEAEPVAPTEQMGVEPGLQAVQAGVPEPAQSAAEQMGVEPELPAQTGPSDVGAPAQSAAEQMDVESGQDPPSDSDMNLCGESYLLTM